MENSIQSQSGRKIIHVDMDAFFAAAEVLDNPKLRGLPIIVGGTPETRGVVSTASYEARKFGIHSGMSSAYAKRLCPQVLFLKSRFMRYRILSNDVFNIFSNYTDRIESMSLDEAWLDVTENLKNISSATEIGNRIRNDVFVKTGLTCSVGVSYNKFLAKIASDENKPNGICVIPPDKSEEFLKRLSLKKIPGVGKVMQKHLAKFGIAYGYQLLNKSEDFLERNFGKMGKSLFHKIRGIGNDVVCTEYERKSLSVEHTFPIDYEYSEELLFELKKVVKEFCKRLHRSDFSGNVLMLKLKFADFKRISRQISKDYNLVNENKIYLESKALLKKICFREYPGKKVRLIGVGVGEKSNKSTLKNRKLEQMILV